MVWISTEKLSRARTGATGLAAVLLALGAWVGGARAEEAKTPVSVDMILRVFAEPVESRVSAFDQALREDGPPRRAAECAMEADGTMRCGTDRGGIVVTVRNPCPPGTAHYEPPPLPGRRARN